MKEQSKPLPLICPAKSCGADLTQPNSISWAASGGSLYSHAAGNTVPADSFQLSKTWESPECAECSEPLDIFEGALTMFGGLLDANSTKE